MNRFDFSPYRRSTVGFDRLFDMLEGASRANAGDNSPPFNIERLGEDSYRITLAVAGFSEDDLDVTTEENQLIIRGRQADQGPREYLHRGIASRQFQRMFVLADGMEVLKAELKNGLLSVDLARPNPERLVKKINISVSQ